MRLTSTPPNCFSSTASIFSITWYSKVILCSQNAWNALSLTHATQMSNYCSTISLVTCVCDTFKTKSIIGEIEDTSPALYFCQAALVVPRCDITHAEPGLHQPAMRTRFGVCSWNPPHAKTFDPPNIVSSCAGPQQLCKHATVYWNTLRCMDYTATLTHTYT